MFSRFFIDRPIFASVISLMFILAGAISIKNLPIAQYPDLSPPTIVVEANYPGASSETISELVQAPLEQKINGVEDMMYMNSVASSNGRSTTTISFKIGSDPDKAMINVNNRVQMVSSQLPEEVKKYGITVNKRSSAILQVIALYSSDKKYNATYLGNYAFLHIVDELKRLEGVGDASVISGNEYAMRVWLKPDRLAKMGIATNDVIAAISAQNAQHSAGSIGKAPMNIKVDRNYMLISPPRFSTVEEFKNIIIRAKPNGTALRLKEIADVELGAQTYDVIAKTNGMEAVPVMISLSPGANALSTAKRVNDKIEELSSKYPDGIHHKITYETSKFVKNSINEVLHTMLEAGILVFLIILIFLKSIRATIIPSLAIPVSIIGAFAGLFLFNFSINTLTLFGLVLAIGIVVDDAIVVMENVERIMRTKKLAAREATIEAMDEVSGALISIVLVLCAVFIPVSFMGGLAGTMYKQFAITISVSVVISGIVALTLIPALCVIFLSKPQTSSKSNILSNFFAKFDKYLEIITEKYMKAVHFFISHMKIAFISMAGFLISIFLLFQITPKSLLPEEDQGVLLSCAILDPAASLDRSYEVISKVSNELKKNPAIKDTMLIAGYNLLSSSVSSNGATMFVLLHDWKERKKVEESSFSIAKQLFGIGMGISDGTVLGICPPPIVGMSTTGGFEGYLQQTGNMDSKKLEVKTRELIAEASKRPELTGITTMFNASTPKLTMKVDNLKALSFNVPISEIYATMAATFNTYYVNDFSKNGRGFKVMVQAKDNYRAYPEDINEIYVRSTTGHMIPISAFVTLKTTVGTDIFERFNLFPSAKIIGNPASGYSSGDAIKAMEQVSEKILGEGYSFEWSGSSYQEKVSGDSAYMTLLLSLFVVFLILAAQYERWTLPIVVISAVPFAIFGALVSVLLRGYTNDIYFQIALITLIGLSAKNAILIVEFAVMLRKEGLSLIDAAMKAASMRFRPILMTSLTFIFGTLPLAISSGAGAASRKSLGTGIVGGMIGATLFAPLFIPVMYVAITALSEHFRSKKEVK